MWDVSAATAKACCEYDASSYARAYFGFTYGVTGATPGEKYINAIRVRRIVDLTIITSYPCKNITTALTLNWTRLYGLIDLYCSFWNWMDETNRKEVIWFFPRVRTYIGTVPILSPPPYDHTDVPCNRGASETNEFASIVRFENKKKFLFLTAVRRVRRIYNTHNIFFQSYVIILKRKLIIKRPVLWNKSRKNYNDKIINNWERKAVASISDCGLLVQIKH